MSFANHPAPTLADPALAEARAPGIGGAGPGAVANAGAGAAGGPADAAMVSVVADSVSKRFGARTAVHDVSLTLAAGECLALFGPNGAGKTTLLRLLGGLIRPTRGSITVHGAGAPGDAATRALVGLISHQSMLYSALTARENVEFAARCYGLPNVSARARHALETLQVADRAETPVRQLSRGLQQRVSIARALVHQPRVLLLDEPYTGLDEVGARAFTNALQLARQGGATLVLVTHHLAEGLALATRAAVMLAGRFVADEVVPAGEADVQAFTARYRALVTGGAW